MLAAVVMAVMTVYGWLTGHPAVAASIGAVVIAAIATYAWARQKTVSTDALATRTTLEQSAAIVTEHGAELSTSRGRLTTTMTDGCVDDSKWLVERDLFIDQIVEPLVGNITNSLERLLAVWQMIDDATTQFASSRTAEPPVPSVASGRPADALLTTALDRAA
ncbi:MAG: hypothetical protein ACYDBZ_10880 [Steroidobacteraceae bacterium]